MPILSTISGTTVGGRDGHGETSDGLIKADFQSKAAGQPGTLFCPWLLGLFRQRLEWRLALEEDSAAGRFQRHGQGRSQRRRDHDYSLIVELQVKLPGIEKAQAEELVKAADQMCPYSKAIRGNVPVTLTVL